MKLDTIDNGRDFDFGRVSCGYAEYRDIYPESMYQKLVCFGIGRKGQRILDLGSGTAVLPVNMSKTGAEFVSTDISENQIFYGRRFASKKGIKNISFKVCPAEETGFSDNNFDVVTAVQCFHYFNAEAAASEIRRVLKPGGLFCKIFMDWLPFEDEVINATERLVLKYNPDWNGNGFKSYEFSFPGWARGRFTIDTINSYDTELKFSKDAWVGRVRSCRGVGAALSENEVTEFENEFRRLLSIYSEPLILKHQIHIEIFRSTKKA